MKALCLIAILAVAVYGLVASTRRIREEGQNQYRKHQRTAPLPKNAFDHDHYSLAGRILR